MVDIKVFTNNYRGIVAKNDIKKGEQVLFVPDLLLVSYDLAK